MRLVIQRVANAEVTVAPDYAASIGHGLMILVGVENEDTDADVDYLARKTAALRIFDDENGVMNRSVTDVKGEILAVSQFTLLASTRKGNRPSYIRSAPGQQSQPLYEKFCETLSILTSTDVKRGVFGAHMMVSLTNDGPVTIIIDSRIKE